MAELLSLLGLALMAALPATFFRRGRFNVAWCLTAAPFALAGGALAVQLARPLWPGHAVLDSLSVLASACAMALILAARAAHRAPVALWHQDQVPEDLVAAGPYSRVRHPFYAAFLLLLAAAVLALPGLATGLALAWGLAALSATAAAEERALMSSPLGERYRDYARRTGRFVPRLRRQP